jgi:hypothetical protein
MPHGRAAGILDELVTLRGQVAHRVAAARPVRKRYVQEMRAFIARLALASNNAIPELLLD